MDSRPLTKFVEEPSSHLKCFACALVYSDPVINVRCGHTFCRKCIFNFASCPVDGQHCDTSQLVVNRLVVGQIEDLLIHCQYGIKWQEKELVVDPAGCSEVIPLGRRAEHESQCSNALFSCQNNTLCGLFRKCEMDQHMQVCAYHPCIYKSKGCEFTGIANDVLQHSISCSCSKLTKNICECQQLKDEIWNLQQKNKEFNGHLNVLTNQIKTLGDKNNKLSEQLETCTSQMSKLQHQCDSILSSMNLANGTQCQTRGSICNSNTDSSTFSLVKQKSERLSYSGSISQDKYEKWEMPFHFMCIGTLRGHKDVVFWLTCNKHKLYSAGADRVIKVWDLHHLAKGCLQTLHSHSGVVHSMVVVAGGSLFSAGSDLSITKWNLENLSEKPSVYQNAHDNLICSMRASDDYLFTSSYSMIKVWDLKSLILKHSMPGLHHWVRCMALNITKDTLYSGSHNSINVWKIKEFNLEEKINHNYGSLYSLVATKLYLIAGTYNKNIAVFDINTKQQIHHLVGHIASVNALVVSPSEKFLFSGSGDKSIKVWDLEKMLPIQSLSRHSDSVNTLSLYGDFLLSGSSDHEIKLRIHTSRETSPCHGSCIFNGE